ncbi:hydroxyacid dehydrogenase [Caulobacter sp. CCUG 60055]|nr:2-hydroxyacid dehydrogenase [Caulobacter sp. CCUG 60055]MBQ1542875.1 2-hydroxyacid dehydrogenase [Caulobacteraceae bacterium]MCI3181152.1 hydroxyacid dehydrogenase [Caulobacter sp. CCUG 60055]
MPDAKPVILLSHEMLLPMQPLLEPAYVVARLWEHKDRLAFLDGVGRKVQAVVHAGEFRLEPDLLAEMPRLGLIACVSVGYDGVDVPWCRAHGVAVTHAPSLNADDVADHAVGSLIAVWRGLVEGDRRVRDGRWEGHERLNARRSLGRKKAGVVGLGGIGEAVARRLEVFGLQVAWWGPRPKPDARWPRASSLLDLAKDSDVLVVACRAEAANRGLIDRAVIEALGPRGCLVNVARGSVVDEDALIAALKDGRLGMAALDVFEKEPTPAARWKDVPNTVLTPHTAGATLESAPQMVAMCLENLRCFFHGEPLASPVGGSAEPRAREAVEEYR